MDECKPLVAGDIEAHVKYSEEEARIAGRGLRSSTSQLNLSALYGMGGARMDCAARVKGVLGGV